MPRERKCTLRTERVAGTPGLGACTVERGAARLGRLAGAHCTGRGQCRCLDVWRGFGVSGCAVWSLPRQPPRHCEMVSPVPTQRIELDRFRPFSRCLGLIIFPGRCSQNFFELCGFLVISETPVSQNGISGSCKHLTRKALLSEL